MGELTIFLGLQVKQKQDGIFISQDKYVAVILKKFRFSEVKTASTPMETSKPLLKDEDGQETVVANSTIEAEYVAASSCCGQEKQKKCITYCCWVNVNVVEGVGNKMHKAFPPLVRKFPLLEGASHCLKRNATARRKVLLLPEVCTAIIVKEKP
nr:ribonuclease H-like domain-containing protein [Tanacetum cinerariifolium]